MLQQRNSTACGSVLAMTLDRHRAAVEARQSHALCIHTRSNRRQANRQPPPAQKALQAALAESTKVTKRRPSVRAEPTMLVWTAPRREGCTPMVTPSHKHGNHSLARLPPTNHVNESFAKKWTQNSARNSNEVAPSSASEIRGRLGIHQAT
jgi:hypothetical protein